MSSTEPPPPPGHRAAGQALSARPREIRIGRKLAARRCADLVEPAREFARAREPCRRRRAVAGPAVAVAASAPLDVNGLAGGGILSEQGAGSREQENPEHSRPLGIAATNALSHDCSLPDRSLLPQFSPTSSASTPSARTGTESPTRSPAR